MLFIFLTVHLFKVNYLLSPRKVAIRFTLGFGMQFISDIQRGQQHK